MESKESKAQIEVWEWKEKLSKELNKLPYNGRIAYVTKRTAPIIAKLGLKRAKLRPELR